MIIELKTEKKGDIFINKVYKDKELVCHEKMKNGDGSTVPDVLSEMFWEEVYRAEREEVK